MRYGVPSGSKNRNMSTLGVPDSLSGEHTAPPNPGRRIAPNGEGPDAEPRVASSIGEGPDSDPSPLGEVDASASGVGPGRYRGCRLCVAWAFSPRRLVGRIERFCLDRAFSPGRLFREADLAGHAGAAMSAVAVGVLG